MNKKPYNAQDEIAHEVLDKKHIDDPGNVSGRYKPLNTEHKLILVDKVIYPVNVCPTCKGQATFHYRMQQTQPDGFTNVWRMGGSEDDGSKVTTKYDYCLDCRKEFLFEMYIWKKELIK